MPQTLVVIICPLVVIVSFYLAGNWKIDGLGNLTYENNHLNLVMSSDTLVFTIYNEVTSQDRFILVNLLSLKGYDPSVIPSTSAIKPGSTYILNITKK